MTHNLTGKVFGHLTVIKKVENDYQGKNQWLCKCACGNYKTYITNMLTGSRGAKTCRNCQDHIKHKQAYTSWMAARQRCRDVNHKDYKRYGGAGIVFCSRWDDFKFFLQDLGDPPYDSLYKEYYSLDRKNNLGNYEPENCRWADRMTQASNR